MKGFLTAIFLILSTCAFSQTDSATRLRLVNRTDSLRRPKFTDPASLARWRARADSIKAAKDSIRVLGDSIGRAWIKAPDPGRKNQFIDSLVRLNTIKNFDLLSWAKNFKPKVNHINEGKIQPKGESWLLAFVILLLLFFAVLKNSFSKDLGILIQSLWSNRVLAQIIKDEGLFSSWQFVFLYILFGFTIGTFLYLCGKLYHLTYLFDGFQWLIILSVAIIALFTLKIILLKILGFIFNVQRVVGEYISVLYLSYFNTAVFFLPLVFAFCLTRESEAQIYIYIAFLIFAITFLFQFLRIATNIIASYKFSKVYLFIYLCALEICPLLVLIKALRF